MPGVERGVGASAARAALRRLRRKATSFAIASRAPLVVSALLLLLPSPVLAQSYVVRATATPCMNVRAAAEADASIKECIPPGTLVTEVDSAPYWRKVRLQNGTEGWAAKKYLESSPAPPASPTPASNPDDAWLEVHFVDVGQGDGIWIHTFDDGIDGNGIYEGRNIVIDGGPNSADATNEMRLYLEARGHHGGIIDTLIVSHPHDDHYPGAEGLLRHFEVVRFFDPGYPKDGISYPAFLAAARAETANGQPVVAMVGKSSFQPIDWGSEITAEILYAYPGVPTGLGSGSTRENNSSIVLKLTYGTRSFLFMGDAEGKNRADSPDTPKYVEKMLLDTVAPQLKADVLKIAHHGSETSSTTAFIQAVDPSVVVVCSGRRPYGGKFLPDATTLKRYCCHNSAIRIYRTDQNDEAEGLTGANDSDGDHVLIRTNGTDLEVTALEGGQPFPVTSCKPAC